MDNLRHAIEIAAVAILFVISPSVSVAENCTLTLTEFANAFLFQPFNESIESFHINDYNYTGYSTRQAPVNVSKNYLVQITCNGRYTKVGGDSFLRCTVSDGGKVKWTGELGKCLIQACWWPRSKKRIGEFRYENERLATNSGGFPEGTIFVSHANVSSRCQANGTWSNVNPHSAPELSNGYSESNILNSARIDRILLIWGAAMTLVSVGLLGLSIKQCDSARNVPLQPAEPEIHRLQTAATRNGSTASGTTRVHLREANSNELYESICYAANSSEPLYNDVTACSPVYDVAKPKNEIVVLEKPPLDQLYDTVIPKSQRNNAKPRTEPDDDVLTKPLEHQMYEVVIPKSNRRI